jgi:uncharacterized protein
MGLKEKISDDLKAAMKSGEKIRLETLRTIRAAILDKEIELRPGGTSELAPEQEIALLQNAAKKRKEAIEMYQKGGRQDLVDQETSELAIISEYLPKQLSEEEVLGIIKQVISETGALSAADFPKVMPQVMKQLKGKADGKVIQALVRQLLPAS